MDATVYSMDNHRRQVLGEDDLSVGDRECEYTVCSTDTICNPRNPPEYIVDPSHSVRP